MKLQCDAYWPSALQWLPCADMHRQVGTHYTTHLFGGTRVLVHAALWQVGRRGDTRIHAPQLAAHTRQQRF